MSRMILEDTSEKTAGNLHGRLIFSRDEREDPFKGEQGQHLVEISSQDYLSIRSKSFEEAAKIRMDVTTTSAVSPSSSGRTSDDRYTKGYTGLPLLSYRCTDWHKHAFFRCLGQSVCQMGIVIDEEKSERDTASIQPMFIVRSRALTLMLGHIRRISSYKTGWDGAKGQPPSESAIQDATRFVYKLARNEVIPPHISLAADGEINFFWMLPRIRLDLGLYGDGTYSYYGETPTGDEFMGDDISIETVLPEQILQLLND